MRYLVTHTIDGHVHTSEFRLGSRAYRVLMECVPDPDMYVELHYDSRRDIASGRVGLKDWWHVERRELQ